MTELMTLLAQATPPAAAAPGAAGEEPVKTIFQLVMQGGVVMAPIALCSIVALAIIVERLVMTSRQRVIPRGFLSTLPERIDDRDRVVAACKANGSPVANILAVAVRRLYDPPAILEKRVEEAGMREVVSLRRRMRVLSALPQISTMLGLLGTIFGMIRTFRAVAASGQALGKTELLARGIHEAWVATASGLLVAIPVMIAYHALQGRIDSLVAEMDRIIRDFLDQWEEPAPSATPARIQRPAAAKPTPTGDSVSEPASTPEPATV
jgi:biopolymer transport protein ExbB